MKKTILILTLLSFIASACKQTTKKQTEEVTYSSLIQKITSQKYFSLKEKTNTPAINLEKITDLAQAKKMLKGRVIWSDKEYYENAIYKIKFRNGKTLVYDYPDLIFVAYYPQEDILLLEGGHASNVSFNLTTGGETEDVGNPDYIVFSPSKKYRLTGYHSGQDWIYYFIQKKIDGHYRRIYNLDSDFEKKTGFDICFILDAFWENDSTLNFVRNRWAVDEYEKSTYYQLILYYKKRDYKFRSTSNGR